MEQATIFDFVKKEENAYRTLPIAVTDNWEWQMFEHIKRSILYKNSQYETGKLGDKPFKNIIRPLLNLAYRAEGFDVKDITLYVNDADDYYKSFLVKKFHEKWARKNGIDTFIDELVESYCDFGGALVKNTNSERPEVVPLQSIAFCDQTDLLSGPLALKHYYAPDQLKEMESAHWGDENHGATGTINEVITLAENEKRQNMAPIGKKAKTPGKYIEVYEVHGMFPNWWLESANEEMNENPSQDDEAVENQFSRQLHIITYYRDENGTAKGITLFKGKEKDGLFKLIVRDKIYGRALGLGGAEELFEPQIWTNYDIIRMHGMLDMASKVIYKTTDPAFANRNKTSDLDNGEVLVIEPNSLFDQINTVPINLQVFERAVAEWDQHAKEMASASPALLGTAPTNHTSFAFQRLITQQATALHDYRRGKLAVFMEEIYREWILPYIIGEISKGQKFLSELTVDELQQVADSLVACQTNDMIKAKILNGEQINPQDVQQFQQKVKDEFMKGGNKRFIEILKGELEEAPIDVEADVGGKQKDLQAMSDSLTKIFQQIVAAPQVLEDPRMAKIFNMILESSGFSPIDFYAPPQQPQDNSKQDSGKISESINYKDLPPEGQAQLAAKGGIKITAPQAPAQPVGALTK